MVQLVIYLLGLLVVLHVVYSFTIQALICWVLVVNNL